MGTYNYVGISFFIFLAVSIIFLLKPNTTSSYFSFDIYKLGSNYLSIYIFLTSLIMVIAFIKKRTQNDAQKVIRLANFFWVIPAKIFIILYGISMFLEGIKALFFTLFKPIQGARFPPLVSMILNYGIVALLFIYALFGQELITLFIIFIVITSIIAYSMGRTLGYSLFPYEFKQLAGSNDTDIWTVLKWLWNIFLMICYIVFLMIITIPISYVIAFIYRYDLVEDMPAIPEMPTFKKT